MYKKENELRERAIEQGIQGHGLLEEEVVLQDESEWREVSPEDQAIIERWDRQNRYMVPP